MEPRLASHSSHSLMTTCLYAAGSWKKPTLSSSFTDQMGNTLAILQGGKFGLPPTTIGSRLDTHAVQGADTILGAGVGT